MTDGPAPSPPELPDAAAAALTDAERQVVAWLQDADVDADEIARRLLTDADRDQSN
jgi:DNA-binding CsgD family transcriptional regulator